MPTDTAPLSRTISKTVPGATILLAESFAVGEAPFAGTVTGASYTPDAASTGDAAHYRTYTIVNKGAAGIGTTVMGTLALLAGINLVAFDEKAFTLSVVANALDVVEGDQLAFVSTPTGNGLVDPGGTVNVEILRS